MFRDYLEASRSPRYSILFAAPLWIAYEALAWALNSPAGPGVRNGADVMFKAPFARLAGGYGVAAFEALLLGIGAWLVVRDWRAHRGPLRLRTFGLMFAESIALALVIGVVLRFATAALLQHFSLSRPGGVGLSSQLMVSLGAGIYEELLFRVVLVGALTTIATGVFRWEARGAAIFAVVLSALLFSAFHYVGVYGDTFRAASFVFRFLAGLLFSTLYVMRGFGITAWAHAGYDVIVILSG